MLGRGVILSQGRVPSRAKAWLLASRPKTLSAAIAPVLVGSALAYRRDHDLPWRYAICALLGAVLIQIATNFINDALDFKKGADTAERLGPLRVTQAGLLPYNAVMRAAYACLGLAAVVGVPLIVRGGWPLLTIGVLSILAAYAYTGGPFPLAYHGLGELFVLIFFGIVAVGGTYYVLVLEYGTHVFLAGLAVGLLSVAILAINNLRDIQGDRLSNKRTVAVRIGERAARIEIGLSAITPLFIAAGIAVLLADRRLFLPLLAAPVALALVHKVYRSTGAMLNRCLALASVLLWIFSLLFPVAVLL